ncbi:MAG: ATP-binding cassette domain-containing protein, partial [Bacteroidetes bacterium]
MFLKKLSHIFLPQEKRSFVKLLLAILVLSLLEVMGVASILPFMELIANPDAIQSNPLLARIYAAGYFSSERQMLIASGVLVILLISTSNLFGIYTLWRQYRFTWGMAHRLGMRLLKSYLAKPYTYYLQVNTSELKTYLIGEVGTLTAGVLLPIIDLIARITVALVIFGLLIYVNPWIAISSLLLLGGIYALIYLFRQRTLQRLGEERIVHNVGRYRSLAELLSGIKLIKANDNQDFFYQRYEQSSRHFSNIMPRFTIIMVAPKYILEIFAFGGILTITLALYVQEGNLQDALPVLSLYALAGYRLLPALQQGFAALSKLRHNLPVLDKLHEDLHQALTFESSNSAQSLPSLAFEREIRINKLTFSYPEQATPVLQNFDLTISKGQVVAFVGSTGSGKTTLVDLLTGLLQPTAGGISIDGQLLDATLLPAWRQLLAYVPQQ